MIVFSQCLFYVFLGGGRGKAGTLAEIPSKYGEGRQGYTPL